MFASSKDADALWVAMTWNEGDQRSSWGIELAHVVDGVERDRATINRALGAGDYATKLARYPESASRMTQAIDAPDWTPQAVTARQKDLAGKAAQRWRLDY